MITIIYWLKFENSLLIIGHSTLSYHKRTLNVSNGLHIECKI